jgi:hypothetical protein
LANLSSKNNQLIVLDKWNLCDPNCLGQLIINTVSAILHGNHTAASATGYHSDGFAAVTTQGKQKRIEFFILCFDPLDNIFFADLGVGQVHTVHLIP